MLSAGEKAAIQESWRLLTPVAEAALDLFFQRLLQQNPRLHPETHQELAARKKELIALLDFALRALDWDEADWREDVDDDYDLFMVMIRMGRSYPPIVRLIHEHYSAVGEALLGALGDALGARFDATTRRGWSRLYTLLANALRMGRLAAREGLASEPVGVSPSPGSTLRGGVAS